MSARESYPCGICGQLFKKKVTMLTHESNHTRKKPHQCNTCEKSFSDKSSLVGHERIHSGDKPYSCELCEKAFTQLSHLAQHKRLHTGEKPYACDICEKTFVQSSSLVQHKRVHTGEKPFKCVICEKTFGKNNDLTIHIRLHTGEKPYECKICEKSFISKSHFNKHEKSVGHSKRKGSQKAQPSTHLIDFVDCDDSFKLEDIKEELNEEGMVYDPLSIQRDRTESESQNIVTELKEEVIDDAILFVQEIHNSGYEENNTVGDDIDIVEHKIEIEDFTDTDNLVDYSEFVQVQMNLSN